MSKSFKALLSAGVALGVLTLSAGGALAETKKVETTTTKAVVVDPKTGQVVSSTPGDVKTSNDDSGMKHDEAPHDKLLVNGRPAK